MNDIWISPFPELHCTKFGMPKKSRLLTNYGTTIFHLSFISIHIHMIRFLLCPIHKSILFIALSFFILSLQVFCFTRKVWAPLLSLSSFQSSFSHFFGLFIQWHSFHLSARFSSRICHPKPNCIFGWRAPFPATSIFLWRRAMAPGYRAHFMLVGG